MSTSAKPMFAFARCDRLKTLAQLQKAQAHADRSPDARCKVRPGTSPERDQVRWTRGAGDGVFDLVEGWRDAKGAARERHGAPICLHLLLVVSPEWVQRSGGLHDRDNPANMALLTAAREFAEREIGQVAAVRLDLDEDGGAVVDVFCVPVSKRQRRLRKDGSRASDGVMEISINKAFERLRAKTKERGDYSALQSAWAGHAQTYLDPALERGQRKWVTGRRHLETPEFRQLQTELTALEERAEAAKRQIEHTENERRRLADLDRSLAEREAKIAEQEKNYKRSVNLALNQLGQAWSRRVRGVPAEPDDDKALNWPIAITATEALDKALEQISTKTREIAEKQAWLSTWEEKLARQASEIEKREQKLQAKESAATTQDADLQRRSKMLDSRTSQIVAAEVKIQNERKKTNELFAEAQELRKSAEDEWFALERHFLGTDTEADAILLARPERSEIVSAINRLRREIELTTENIEARSANLVVGEQQLQRQKAGVETSAHDNLRKASEIDKMRRALAQHEDELVRRERQLRNDEASVVADRKNIEAAKAKARQEARFIKSVGDALGKWLVGNRTAEATALLTQPMAKPFTNAFNSVLKEITERHKAASAKEAALRDQEISAKERLSKLDMEASELADLIARNSTEAKKLERFLAREINAIEHIASQLGNPSPVPRLRALIDRIEAQNSEAPRLQQARRPSGYERD